MRAANNQSKSWSVICIMHVVTNVRGWRRRRLDAWDYPTYCSCALPMSPTCGIALYCIVLHGIMLLLLCLYRQHVLVQNHLMLRWRRQDAADYPQSASSRITRAKSFAICINYYLLFVSPIICYLYQLLFTISINYYLLFVATKKEFLITRSSSLVSAANDALSYHKG